MIPDMSERDLRRFALDWCDGKIFSSRHIESRYPNDPHTIGLVFMVLVLGGAEHISEEDEARVGLIWEYVAEAAPRGINGMPCFLSCRFMSRPDWEKAVDLIVAEEARRKDYLEGTP